MEHYRDEEKVPGLADCAPTVAFIRKVNDLVHAMNANTPWDSIRKAEYDEPEIEEVDSFRTEEDEIIEMETEAVTHEYNQAGFKKKDSARQV